MGRAIRALGVLLAGMWAGHAAAGLIDIGSQKQLFLDDYLIERKTNAERVMHQGTRVSDGPLQLHDKPWEGNYNLVRSIHQDPKSGELVMFYRTTEFTSEHGFNDEATRLCLAHSNGGKLLIFDLKLMHPDSLIARNFGVSYWTYYSTFLGGHG